MKSKFYISFALQYDRERVNGIVFSSTSTTTIMFRNIGTPKVLSAICYPYLTACMAEVIKIWLEQTVKKKIFLSICHSIRENQ